MGTCNDPAPRLASALFFGKPVAANDCRTESKQDFMAVRISMKRIGTTNPPVYRIVVADNRSPRDGKFIEEIGTYQPLKKADNVTLRLDPAGYWLSKGRKPQ